MSILAAVLVSGVLIFAAASANAELEPLRYLAHPLDATINTASLVASDAPMPMTHFKKGEWKLAVNPLTFKVTQAYLSSEGEGGGADFRGDNLNGYGGSLTGAYAFSHRWQVFGIFSGVSMKGRLIGKAPASAAADQHRLDGSSSYFVMATGLGYELLESPAKWSSVVYLGLSLQRYAMTMTSESLDGTQPNTRIDGSGMLVGSTFGIQGSYRIDENFAISPYFFLLAPFTKPTVSIEVVETSGSQGVSQGQIISGTVGDGLFPIPGVNISYDAWNVGLNLGGLVASLYSKALYEGLEITKLSISYSWGSD